MPDETPTAQRVRFREIALDSPEYERSLDLRETILRHPLGLKFTAEELAREPGCLHLAGLLGEEVVATLLLEPVDESTAQMRQVAVREDVRNLGVGASLLAAAERAAIERGFRRLFAHARAPALVFYERNGYAPEGDFFIEASIPHRQVAKQLA